MTGPDLRSALHDLGEQARVPDLLDRALATSRRIRRRRVAAGAAATAVVLVTTAVAVAVVRSPDGTVAPPATGTSAPQPSSTPAPSASTTTTPAEHPTVGQPPPPATPGGTAYYLRFEGSSMSLYSWSGREGPKLVASGTSPGVTVSPDGTKLAWIDGVADGDPAATVMVSDLDGGNQRAVADARDMGGLCNVPAWSPDSRRILFPPSGGNEQPWMTVDIASGERTTLASAGRCYPTWAPDGGTIGWYSSRSGATLTDALGRNARTVPPVDGIRAPCGMAIFAVAPGGGRAFVDVPIPEPACGDGPGRRPWRGAVVDTSTGRSLDLPVDGGLSSAVFLADGGLVGISEATDELVRLDADLDLVARSPAPPGDGLVLLAYVP